MALLSLAGLFRWTPPAVAVPVVLIALVLQVREANFTFVDLRATLSRPTPELLDRAQLGTWMQQHRRVFQFPSWSCGGLVSGTVRDNEPDTAHRNAGFLA
jgi:hypothetical protein